MGQEKPTTRAITVEICVANLESALLAQQAGAHRIEMCSGLEHGGVTPGPGFIIQAKRLLHIPVCVLIRPRFGDFIYSEHEFESMLSDIEFCKQAGVFGVSVGVLTPDHRLHLERMRRIVETAAGLEIVFNRAFDVILREEDRLEALDLLLTMGVRKVLSSGSSDKINCASIKRYLNHTGGQVSIVAASGLTHVNFKQIARESGARDFHGSCKHLFDREKQAEGLPGLPLVGLEPTYLVTSLKDASLLLQEASSFEKSDIKEDERDSRDDR